jgi:REP element-mobilizing transposase RayT
METRLKELIGQVCQACRADVAELEIMPEHVHLLVNAKAPIGWQAFRSPLKINVPNCLDAQKSARI